jgi:hypothetical protein
VSEREGAEFSHGVGLGALAGVVGALAAVLALWWQAGERGYAVGRAHRGSDQAIQTASGIDFQIPGGWVQVTPSAPLRGLGVTLVWAYAPAGQPAGGEVAIGLGDARGPTLLSRRTLALLHARNVANIEELRSNAFVHVSGTLRSGHTSQAVLVYAQPASPHNVEIICVAPAQPDEDAETRACRLVAGTLQLTPSYGHAITLGQLAAYPARVQTALAKCYGRAASLRDEFWRARDRPTQARQARLLGALYDSAARLLADVRGDPIAAPAAETLAKALRLTADGYALLERAAADGNRREWEAGRRRVLAGQTQMDLAVRDILLP